MKFWVDKKILITGHSGFKGGWLSLILEQFGSKVVGIGLEPNTSPSFYNIINLNNLIKSNICDIRNQKVINKIFDDNQPDIVFHLAAQPLVSVSYEDPFETYETNVLGTLNILEAIKNTKSVKSCIIVTSDKCYDNKEWVWGYRENDVLGGHDPYSSSKACAEILVSSYNKSFFYDRDLQVATVRAGNVIGGGDWAKDRLIPDIYRSIENNKKMAIRNPLAVRPWQHVLDPLFGYLKLAETMYMDDKGNYNGGWNFGPNNINQMNVKQVIDFIRNKIDYDLPIELLSNPQFKETNFLKLDCSKSKQLLGWSPVWGIDNTLDKTIEWYNGYLHNENLFQLTLDQIKKFISELE